MRGSAAYDASTSHSICRLGNARRMSCTTGSACTTSPIDDVLMISTRMRASPRRCSTAALLLLGDQRRVEARIVVHLELAVHLEVRAAGGAVGQQRVEA